MGIWALKCTKKKKEALRSNRLLQSREESFIVEFNVYYYLLHATLRQTVTTRKHTAFFT